MSGKPTQLKSIIVRQSGLNKSRGTMFAGVRHFHCALGRSGLTHLKREGDGATPVGQFRIIRGYYRADRVRACAPGIELERSRKDQGWCDAPDDRNYNRSVKMPYSARHEKMWRKDGLYDLCLVLDQNYSKRMRGFGRDMMAPHSMTLTLVGAAMLWVGWFGFNAGSNLEANGGATLAMINTFTATAGAIIAWSLLESILRGQASMLGAASGMVAGLVAVTPAAGSIGPVGAIFLGMLGSAGCYFFVAIVKNKFGYDDSLDVFGIHGIGGIIGAVGTGIFTSPLLGGTGGADYSIAGQTTTQIYAVLITIAWCGIGSIILYKLVDLVFGLRASEQDERQGLDLSSHGEAAYHS